MEPTVGMVYPVCGGRGMKNGHLMVLLAIREPQGCYETRAALMLVIRKDGSPFNVTDYGLHYLENKLPIAFVDGLGDLDLTMRSL
jgi:hypothetical protein